MTSLQAALALTNASFFGFTLAWALFAWSEDRPAKLPSTLAALNLVAIAILLIGGSA